jgi:nitrous oxidase accessory protein
MAASLQAQVSTSAQFIKAVVNGAPGDTIKLNAGQFIIPASLSPKAGTKIIGAGVGKTIITAHSNWKANDSLLPEKETPDAYLFKLIKAPNITISHLTLTAPNLHGAIYADNADGLELHNLLLRDFKWSSIRTFLMDRFKVHDSTFINAGGKFKWNGGALYMHYTRDSEFWNNTIKNTSTNPDRQFYGFKGRQAINTRIHHNTVLVNFSIELPHEKDENVEIDHNRLDGVISIPKQDGGTYFTDKLSYYIHHNWLLKSYSIEGPRNSIEIAYNYFDFKTSDDTGHMITSFATTPVSGLALIHDNQIKNPGRGIISTSGVYNTIHFYNNHVRANTTTRKDGFFGFHAASDFSTYVIKDNIIENIASTPRPLMRNTASYKALIENNMLKNISDVNSFKNASTGAPRGLTSPLNFRAGAYEQFAVTGWNVKRSLVRARRK